MALNHNSIGKIHRDLRNYDKVLEYHNKALKMHEETNDKVRIADDYGNIGLILGKIGDHERGIDSFSKGLKILRELEEKTGYRHPYTDKLAGYISQMQQQEKHSDKEGW